MKIAFIAGARPNFMKIAPILEQVRCRPAFSARLIHTGQHFSPEMSDLFFRELGIPEPDINLGAGGGSITQQTAEIMRRLEPEFERERPDVVLVVGDVNSTLAAALVAVRHGILVAHVEAGLRSFDRTMPEEINRILTDALSDFLFTSEPSGERNLRAEGVPKEKIFFAGNVMIDTLLRFREKASRSDVRTRLGISDGGYAVVTLHRPSNVDDPANLGGLMRTLRELAGRLPVIFPVHPRTRGVLEAAGINSEGIALVPPMGYLDFLHLMAGARLVCTDSGGIQEETTILGVPCLTLRQNTERPVTITHGTNRLVGTDPEAILRAALETLDAPPPAARAPELWDGQASGRILDVLARGRA